MSVATTTIRIPRTTRDGLARVASDRGISVTRLLSDQVRDWERADWFKSERAASTHLSSQADIEQELWDGTVDDWD